MKAEFINGQVIIHSPITDEHESVSFNPASLLHFHTVVNNSGRVTHEKLMIALTRNNYEPDIVSLAVPKRRSLKKAKSNFRQPIL